MGVESVTVRSKGKSWNFVISSVPGASLLGDSTSKSELAVVFKYSIAEGGEDI
jgi:hypothetical protein